MNHNNEVNKAGCDMKKYRHISQPLCRPPSCSSRARRTLKSLLTDARPPVVAHQSWLWYGWETDHSHFESDTRRRFILRLFAVAAISRHAAQLVKNGCDMKAEHGTTIFTIGTRTLGTPLGTSTNKAISVNRPHQSGCDMSTGTCHRRFDRLGPRIIRIFRRYLTYK